MNIFILGLPFAGKTTVATSLEKSLGLIHLNISDWVKDEFRLPYDEEHEQHYKEELQAFFFEQFKASPNMCTNYANEFMSESKYENKGFIIEGINTPKDFVQLFNANEDIVVFLNRTDNNAYYLDHDNLALPTMRDYCFWLAAAGVLSKNRWLEYNFKIPGEDSEFVKCLGSKNSVFLVKSINNAINHLSDKLIELR